jgi:hypothetical protein
MKRINKKKTKENRKSSRGKVCGSGERCTRNERTWMSSRGQVRAPLWNISDSEEAHCVCGGGRDQDGYPWIMHMDWMDGCNVQLGRNGPGDGAMAL